MNWMSNSDNNNISNTANASINNRDNKWKWIAAASVLGGVSIYLYSQYKRNKLNHIHKNSANNIEVNQVPNDRSALYSQPAYTKLTVDQAKLILSYYIDTNDSAEYYVSHRELLGGLSNSNYQIITNKRSFLCK